MLPEKIVQNDVLDYLRLLEKLDYPVICDRRQAGGFNYKMGIPDVWACINGIHIEIECKAPGKTLRPMQEKYRDKCKRKNILWLCCDNFADFKQFVYEKFKIIV